MAEELPFCECGCGKLVRHRLHRFIKGHAVRCRKKVGLIQGPKQLCECGCGETVRYTYNRFILGHASRCMSDETKKKLSEASKSQSKAYRIRQGNKMRGRKLTDEHKKKLRGRKHSEETKRKMSESQKGKICSEETKKKLSEAGKRNKGRILTDEHKRKLSEAAKGKIISEGQRNKISLALKGRKHDYDVSEETRKKLSASKTMEKHPAWNGGSSFLPYCTKFNHKLKEAIRNRDNRTCQHCGIKENGRRHHVHHIHYDKENCYPDLITLCGSCNVKANGNRKQWEIYYMNKLNDRGLLNWNKNTLI